MKKLEVSRKDLKNNLNLIRKIANSEAEDDNGNKVKIIAVVKGNGIGLGLVKYSKFLVNNGITTLAVSTIDEAIKLRKANIKEEILMLSPTGIRKEVRILIENHITLAIGGIEDLKLIEKVSKYCKKEVNAHIKIDTGMGRYGFLYSEKEDILSAFKQYENIKIVGMYTHFSKPKNEKWTKKQFDNFLSVVEYLKKQKIDTGILHCSASTAFLKYPIMHLNAVRIGSAIQGRTLVKVKGLVKIGKFKTNITEIKTIPKGYNIGYNNTYKTKTQTKIAIIPVRIYRRIK